MVYVNENVDELDLGQALARVSAQRREQALKFRHEKGQRLCLAAYLLLMEGLRNEYGINEPPVFDYSPEGKPCIAARSDIHFNLSHSGNVALCVVSDQPVGADVEVPRKISPSLIDYTMNPEEQAEINASHDPARAFLRLWTQKEALLKLMGKGISNEMKNVLDDRDSYLIETVETDAYTYSIAKAKSLE